MATVQAAGGVIWRRADDRVEVVLVHRPKYDDWTFPKGKLDDGETHDEAARREVLEETGFECALGDELASATYVDAKGRPKRVRYWSMVIERGCFAPNDEVDELRWLAVRKAAQSLTYDHDADVLGSFARWLDGDRSSFT